MEAVDEFEPERDQQRQREEQEDAGRQRLADLGGIGDDAAPGIAQRADEDGEEDPSPRRVQMRIKARTVRGGGCGRGGNRCSHVGAVHRGCDGFVTNRRSA